MDIQSFLCGHFAPQQRYPFYRIVDNPPASSTPSSYRTCTCELSVEGISYVASATASNKLEAKTTAAWKFAMHMLGEGLVSHRDVPPPPPTLSVNNIPAVVRQGPRRQSPQLGGTTPARNDGESCTGNCELRRALEEMTREKKILERKLADVEHALKWTQRQHVLADGQLLKERRRHSEELDEWRDHMFRRLDNIAEQGEETTKLLAESQQEVLKLMERNKELSEAIVAEELQKVDNARYRLVTTDSSQLLDRPHDVLKEEAERYFERVVTAPLQHARAEFESALRETKDELKRRGQIAVDKAESIDTIVLD